MAGPRDPREPDRAARGGSKHPAAIAAILMAAAALLPGIAQGQACLRAATDSGGIETDDPLCSPQVAGSAGASHALSFPQITTSLIDLESIGALLILPYLTDSAVGQETFLSITNAATEGQILRFHFVDGADWSAVNFTCFVTGRETTLVKISGTGTGSSRIELECTDPATGAQLPHIFIHNAVQGFVAVVGETPGSTLTDVTAKLFGEATVIGFSQASSVTLPAWNFTGGTPGPGSTDRDYRFDAIEYELPPRALRTNFRAPNAAAGLETFLILASIDGTLGVSPDVRLFILYYGDDGVPVSGTIHDFPGFTVVSLTDIDASLQELFLGSSTGHIQVTSGGVLQSNVVHDFNFDGGAGFDNIRAPAVVGWMIQQDGSGRAIGRRLLQSVERHPPFAGDVHVLSTF